MARIVGKKFDLVRFGLWCVRVCVFVCVRARARASALVPGSEVGQPIIVCFM